MTRERKVCEIRKGTTCIKMMQARNISEHIHRIESQGYMTAMD